MHHDLTGEPHHDLEIAVEFIACPECAAPAEVSWRSRIDVSTDLAYVRCLLRHWFLMPLDRAAVG